MHKKNYTHKDPVCGRKMNSNKSYAKIKYGKEIYYLCCPLCQSEFEKEPNKYIKQKQLFNNHT